MTFLIMLVDHSFELLASLASIKQLSHHVISCLISLGHKLLEAWAMTLSASHVSFPITLSEYAKRPLEPVESTNNSKISPLCIKFQKWPSLRPICYTTALMHVVDLSFSYFTW